MILDMCGCSFQGLKFELFVNVGQGVVGRQIEDSGTSTLHQSPCARPRSGVLLSELSWGLIAFRGSSKSCLVGNGADLFGSAPLASMRAAALTRFP